MVLRLAFTSLSACRLLCSEELYERMFSVGSLQLTCEISMLQTLLLYLLEAHRVQSLRPAVYIMLFTAYLYVVHIACLPNIVS